MEVSWQSSIDRTLRTTEATLEQLQHRRVTYDRAKRKVDDYLGTPMAATPPRPGPPIDLFEHDVSLPPPLPQHLRYRAAHIPAVPTLQDRPSPVARRDGRRADMPTSPLQLVNAQVRGAMLELELEKAKRADSVRELAYRTTAELAEMRSLITQLQGENSALRKSVRALEGRLGFPPAAAAATAAAPDAGASHLSTSSATAAGSVLHPTRAALLASAVANSGFGLPHDPTSLLARVEALEGGLARQQQLNEDRQTRVTAVLRELVKAEVGADMSQVRALAREAARDSAEDLLKLRLSALQSSTQADLQNALRTAAASETAAQYAQQQCRELEKRLSAQLHRVQTQQADWQRTQGEPANTSGAVAAAAVASQQALERASAVERRVEEQLRSVQAQLRQCATDSAAQAERMAQQHKSLSTAVQAKADAADVMTLRDLLDAQLRGSGGGSAWVTRDQATALVKSQLQPLQDEVRKAQQTAQENHENADAWRRQTGMRFAAVEAGMKEALQEVAQHEQQWQSCTRDVQQLRAEATTSQTRAADAVRQAKAELADAWEVKVQLLDERTQQTLRERHQHAEAQARQLQQALAEQQETQQRARGSGEVVEERLCKAEAALAALEATLPRATDEVRAKCDALQSSLQQTCVLPVTRVQQDLEAVQRTLQSIDDERARSNAGWTQQLTEVKQYYEERARHAREVAEQRLAHHKELHDELRSQQAAQRRTTEEQHQHLLERIAQLQQQQQQQRVHVVTAAPAPSASVDGAATTARADEHEAQMQLVVQRLDGAESRLNAVESTAVGVPGAIADAAAGLSSRLERLEARLQAEAGSATQQQQQQLTEQVHEVQAQVDGLTRRCATTEAALEAHSTHATRRLEEALAPVQLATQLASDATCLQHLALRLQEHLPPLPPDCSAAVAEVEARVATQASAVETSVKALQDEVTAMAKHHKQQQQRLAEESAAVARSPEAESAVTEAPALAPAAAAAAAMMVRAEVQGDLQGVQCAVAELRAQQEDAEQRLATVDQVAAVAADLAAVKSTVATTVSAELATLAEQYAALQASQRQQLPTLQKYVQDVVEVVETNHAAQIDPLLLRLRTAEERHRTLQTRVEEGVAAAAAAEEVNAQVVRELRQAVEQQHKLQEAAQLAAASQLTALEAHLAATRGSVDEVGTRVATAESAREELAAAVRALEEAAVAQAAKTAQEAAALAAAPTAAESAHLVEAPPVSSGAAAVADLEVGLPAGAVAGEAVEELRAYVAELDERLSLLEEQASDSVSATAETLGAFREQLQGVVGRFAAVAAQLGGDAVGTSEAERAANEESAAVGGVREVPAIHNLEDVLLFLLTQLRQLQYALRQLQSNTVDTLEILEQHEESVAPLPMLQHTVDVMAAALVPLAERLGVDAGTLRVLSEQQHQLQHLPPTNLYPPSRTSSSGSSGSRNDRFDDDDGDEGEWPEES